MDRPAPSYAATVAHRLTFVLLVLSLFVAVALTVQGLGGDRDDVTFDAKAQLNDKLLPKGVYPTGEQRTGIVIEDPSGREQRLALAIDLMPLLLWIAVLWFMRGIARSVRDGDPFIASNVQRLRAIGGLLILGTIAVAFADDALQHELLAAYRGTSLKNPGLSSADGDFPEYALLCGLGVLVLAQVFAHGVRLREDVDATI